MSAGSRTTPDSASLSDVQSYWDSRVDDTELSRDPPGSRGYFAAMADYRYSKLDYLPELVGFERWRCRQVLDVGCVAAEGLTATLAQADAARLPFRDASFDLVLCHGVLPFAPDPGAIIRDCRRVLREDGLAIFVAYNRISLMSALRAFSAVGQGHGDAPVFRLHSRKEFDALLGGFADRQLNTARGGWHLVARCRKRSGSVAGLA
jgi:SAM-dependent methyltransferase